MIKFFKKYYKLILIILLVFYIFYPSFKTFYTNDDFFFLKISRINSIGNFFNFFNLARGPDGFGMYRPLTTQVFYFLSWSLFGLNPLGQHVISFIFYMGIIYLIYKLSFQLSGDHKISTLTTLLYSVGASHFAHFYYLATFQEVGMTFFALFSVTTFISYLKNPSKKLLLPIFLAFILSLASKETGIVTPALMGLSYLLLRVQNKTKVSLSKVYDLSKIYVLVVIVYLVVRFLGYGFATGDTYVWDFSIKKLANTTIWYILWSFNLPETLLDFVGPGIKLKPELLVYWGKQIYPIFILFFIQLVFISISLIKALLSKNKKLNQGRDDNSVFAIAWFFISLLPVIFLPHHKYPFYLTLPLFAVVFRVSYLFVKTKLNTLLVSAFAATWIVLSFLTINHTANTHWVTQGANIAQRFKDEMEEKRPEITADKIVFADTVLDRTLPWSPTQLVKTALSDRNFFYVYYPDLAEKVTYGATEETQNDGSYVIISRAYIGY